VWTPEGSTVLADKASRWKEWGKNCFKMVNKLKKLKKVYLAAGQDKHVENARDGA